MTTEESAAGDAPRVAVVVTAPRRSRSTLDMASALARDLHAGLDAVFVEESDLLGIADLPVTHEIDLACGTTRALDSARMARALRAEAENLRRGLASRDAGAASESRGARVHVLRGRYATAAVETAAGVDIAFLHRASRGAPERMRGPVWALFDGVPGCERALSAAASIATELGCLLVALIPASSAEHGDALATRACALVDAAAQGVLVRTVMPQAPGRMAEIAVADGARVLVMARDAAAPGDAPDAHWLASFPVPLVLVA